MVLQGATTINQPVIRYEARTWAVIVTKAVTEPTIIRLIDCLIVKVCGILPSVDLSAPVIGLIPSRGFFQRCA